MNGGIIVKAFSNGFEEPIDSDILVADTDERHFNPVITNERAQYKFRLIDGQWIERSQEELDAELPPPVETDSQKIARLEELIEQLLSR